MKQLLLGILLGALASGCMFFRGGLVELPKQPAAPAGAQPGPALSYDVNWLTFGKPNPAKAAKGAPPIESELRDSALFGSVAKGTDAPYHLDITVDNRGNLGVAVLTGALSGLTLTILPGYARDELEMTAVLTRGGEQVKTYRYNCHITTWIELLLVLGMPFAESDVFGKTLQNMTRHLVADLAHDHVVPAPSGAVAQR